MKTEQKFHTDLINGILIRYVNVKQVFQAGLGFR